jgi:serine/threonine-protein kinase
MAPEQLTGRPVAAGTDVYALGVVLYEMLTGALPFAARSASELAVLQVTEEPRPLSVHRSVPSSLERAVKTALAREQNDRFADVEAFRQALHEVLQDPKAPSIGRRWRVAALAVGLLGALATWWAWPVPVHHPHAGSSAEPPKAASVTPAHQPGAEHAELNRAPAVPIAQPSTSSAAAVEAKPMLSAPERASRRPEKRVPARLAESASMVQPDATNTAPRKPTSLRLDDF